MKVWNGFRNTMLLVNSLIAIYFGVHVLGGCNVDGDHDVKVSGGTTNEVNLNESFCDPSTYPDVASRRQCKDALLAAMKCRTAK